MSPRNQRRRERRAIEAAARAATRAIRIHAKRAFFDFETTEASDRSILGRADRFVAISHDGRSQVSPLAAVDLNIVHHPAFMVDTISMAETMFGRKA